MTNQEAFTTVKDHLLAQGKRSMAPYSSYDSGGAWRCAYRGADGLKCALGILIPDDEYTPELEGNEFMELCPVPPSLRGIDEDLLSALQCVHDYAQPSDWHSELKTIAEMHHLTF